MVSEFLEKVNKLPEPVRKFFASNIPAEQVYRTATSYGIEQKGLTKIASLVADVFVNDVALEKMPEIIQKQLSVTEEVSAGLALNLTKGIFLPLKNHFPNAESLINLWSQKAASPTYQPKSLGIIEEVAEKTKEQTGPTESFVAPQQDTIIELHIRAMIARREDVINQNITEKPLKFADSEALKLPSINNWLTDYKQYKANFPDQDPSLIKTKYLYESVNGKNLSEAERMVVSSLLKSLDDYIRLPFSQKTGRLLIEKLLQPSPAPLTTQPSPPLPSQPQTPKPASQPPSQLPIQPTPPSQSQNIYREPLAPQDLAGPQASQRPTPKLNGNVIDLKNMNINE